MRRCRHESWTAVRTQPGNDLAGYSERVRNTSRTVEQGIMAMGPAPHLPHGRPPHPSELHESPCRRWVRSRSAVGSTPLSRTCLVCDPDKGEQHLTSGLPEPGSLTCTHEGPWGVAPARRDLRGHSPYGVNDTSTPTGRALHSATVRPSALTRSLMDDRLAAAEGQDAQLRQC